MARTDITVGSSFRGPLYVTDADGNELTLTPNATALPTTLDDDSGGTADTTDYTIAAVGDTSTGDQSAAINNNFATIVAYLEALRARIG